MARRNVFAKPKDGVYFRPATPDEHTALQKARAEMLKGWEIGNENMMASAYMTMRKIVDARELPRELKDVNAFWLLKRRVLQKKK